MNRFSMDGLEHHKQDEDVHDDVQGEIDVDAQWVVDPGTHWPGWFQRIIR